MKSAVETLNPTRVKLTVEVPLAELQPSLAKAYKTIGAQVQVKGFRKGKVPPRVIDQRVGRGTVLQEAINEALPGFYRQAVTETEVRPLGQPQVEVTAVPEGEGSALEFTAEVDVRPTIEVPDYASIAVTVDDVEVSDEAVDERLQLLRQRFGTTKSVDRAAKVGDVLSLDLTATVEGQDIETVTGHTYEVGSGQLLEGTDGAVIGAEKGDVKVFTTTLAGGEHIGKEAEVTVTVGSVKERELPDADDDFAQLASEFDTFDEMLADMRVRAERDAEFAQGVQARDRVLEALVEAVDVPVPDTLVEAEVNQHLENESRLEDAEHRAEVDVETRKALKAQLLLDAVAEREGVQVEQAELIEYIVAQAPRYGMDPNAFAKAMEQSGQLPSVVAEVARRKALSVVLEQATVTDASGRRVTLGDEEEDASEAVVSGEVVDDAAPAKKKASPKAKKTADAASDVAADDAPAAPVADDAAADDAAPAKKPARARAAKKPAEDGADEAAAPAAEAPAKTPAAASKTAAAASADASADDAAEAPAKPARKRAPKKPAADA